LAWRQNSGGSRSGKCRLSCSKYFQEGGARIIGLAEYEGAIYNPKGLDVEAVVAHRKKTGSILNYPGAKNLKNHLKP
jgi:glutamate dehydrogenase (NAD(P)+)